MKPDELQREEINHEGTKSAKENTNRKRRNSFSSPLFFVLFVSSWFNFSFPLVAVLPSFAFS